jgi:hypothetical protein
VNRRVGEPIVSIFRLEEFAKQETSMKQQGDISDREDGSDMRLRNMP